MHQLHSSIQDPVIYRRLWTSSTHKHTEGFEACCSRNRQSEKGLEHKRNRENDTKNSHILVFNDSNALKFALLLQDIVFSLAIVNEGRLKQAAQKTFSNIILDLRSPAWERMKEEHMLIMGQRCALSIIESLIRSLLPWRL